MGEKNLQQLLKTRDPAWPSLQSRLQRAANHVVVLPADPLDGQRAVQALQSGAETTLGALALHCGGLPVDGGWLRILGAGNQRLPGSLLDWNGLGDRGTIRTVQGALIVAHDVIGGVFAVNAGGLPGPAGQVAYYSPDTHRWEELGMGYSAWLAWVLDGDLAGFYNHLRWADWEDDLAVLRGDQGVHLWPQPWMLRPFDPDDAARRIVPVETLLELAFTGRAPADGPSH
ncbi:MAG: DUF2625 family protein [Myxococcota bacterium]|nr:DUF2625 family protein [Myxococcota bacterium]MEC8425755.1 DUF2625 family protein [Myxococcota bacterium]